MHGLIKSKTFKTVTLILALAMLTPSAVKFSHTFTHQHHELCDGEPQSHLHQGDFDCDFYKFQLNTNYYSIFDYDGITVTTVIFKIDETLYSFLNNHRPLSFSLRGPPSLI